MLLQVSSFRLSHSGAAPYCAQLVHKTSGQRAATAAHNTSHMALLHTPLHDKGSNWQSFDKMCHVTKGLLIEAHIIHLVICMTIIKICCNLFQEQYSCSGISL